VRDSELAFYTPPHEVLNILGRNGGEGLDLNPLGEVIHLDEEEFGLAEGTNDVHSPDGERPWKHYVVECLRLEMEQMVVLFALSAFLHILMEEGQAHLTMEAKTQS